MISSKLAILTSRVLPLKSSVELGAHQKSLLRKRDLRSFGRSVLSASLGGV